jgi:hypothetical protein
LSNIDQHSDYTKNERHRAMIIVVLFIFLFTFQGSHSRRKVPPMNWDVGPCQRLKENYGAKAACRQCNDEDHGFGSNYNEMLTKALSQHASSSTTTTTSTSTSNNEKEHVWLRIAIGTVPRKSEQPYLDRVLSSIADELPHNVKSSSLPPVGNIEVIVINFRPKKHPVFDRAREKFKSMEHPSREYFTFIELDPVRCDPPVPSNFEYKKGLSPEVSPRQQTRDVVSLYKATRNFMKGGTTTPNDHASPPTCQHTLIVEDDFELCPGGLHLIKHAITKASKGGWSGLRVGVAGNGIVIPCHDLNAIIEYLLDHQFMMPVDLLLPEWFIRIHKRAKGYLHESEIFRINNKNLFNHIGVVSSFGDGRGIRRTSMCGDVLKSKTWMSEESFDTKCKYFYVASLIYQSM